MSRWAGRLISKTPVTPSGPGPTETAPGVWTIPEVAYWNKQGRWPSAGADPYWSYVSYLLSTTSTNAAQNNTFLDSSTNNFTITRAGNTTQGSFTPYAPLWSNYFPGAADNYLSTPNSPAVQFGTGDVTIEAWINLSGNTIADPDGNRQGAICSGIGATGVSNDFWFFVKGNTTTTGTGLYFSVWNGGGGTVLFNTTYTFNKGTWYHVAFTRSGNNIYLFINGALHASSTYTGTITAGSNPLLVGYSQTGASNYRMPFFGYISNLRIVKGTALYTAAFTPAAVPLTAVSGTSLLTCQSNRFIDNSGNAFAVTPVGTPNANTYSPFVLAPPGYDANALVGSGYFDGNGDYLSTSTSVLPTTGSFTAETWFYRTTTDNVVIMYLRGGTGSYAALRVGCASGGIYLLMTTTDGTWIVNSGVISTVVLNVWNHVAVVRNGGTITMYLNGVSIYSTTAISSGSALMSGSSSEIGRMVYGGGTPDFFAGYMSNFRVVSSAIYTSAFTPPTSPLTAISGTSFLCNFTNPGIYDAAIQNDLETAGSTQVSTTQAKYGTTSVAFNGSTDWLSTPNKPSHNFGTGDFTIEMWLYPTTTNAQATAASNYNGPSDGWSIRLGSTGLVFGWGDTAILVGSSTVAQNTWSHIAITRSGTTARMFINGTQVASATDSTDFTTTGTLYLGRLREATAGFFWQGYIDDFRITRGYARYTANFTPPTAALPVY